MQDHLSPEVIAERHERLMLAQQEVAFARARGRVGQMLDVVVDGPDERGILVGRHAGQAPEVDPVCLFQNPVGAPGEAVQTKVVDADGYDLVVQPVGRKLPLVG
jgi:ribosomal protein S12 methylthiotransferase